MKKKNSDEPCQFRKAEMKVGVPTFIPTADEPTTVQTQGMKMANAIFIRK
ncbi:MAG: hypothetical protein NTV84_04010 [Methanoregula sp.]|nr:hypothetical protein [Methanoregula sp.]